LSTGLTARLSVYLGHTLPDPVTERSVQP